jgi:hypothetical protein
MGGNANTPRFRVIATVCTVAVALLALVVTGQAAIAAL